MATRKELLLKRLHEIRLSDGVKSRHLEQQVVDPGLEAISTGPAVTPEVIESWHRFETDKTLSDQDLYHLESIILPKLRPAFDIVGDSYETLPDQWKDINDRRTLIEPLIRGIGRLNLVGHPSLNRVGTAFICGNSILITNRHVAQYFTQGIGEGAQLSFMPGITPSLDLKQEVGSSAAVIVSITNPIVALTDWDIAVFHVSGMPSNVEPLPLSASEPASLEEGVAAVIGYPAFDPADDLVNQIQIFRSTFDKKRLQPGRLKGMKPATSFGQNVQALAHDCSTLGGNSGSAVIDVETGRVVGIHFAGQRLVANYAVPTWVLADHPQLNNIGLKFAT